MPDTPEPLSSEGTRLLNAGLAPDAVDVLRHAVAQGEPDAADLLVRAYFDSGDWFGAVGWLAPLVEQGQVRFAGPLGMALAEIGEAERAETALRLAVESGDLGAATDLAILLRDGDRPGEAVQVLVRAADAGDPEAPANLVQLHLESGDLAAAARAAEHYVDDTRPDTVVALADVRAAQDRLPKADELYRRAVELGAARAHLAYGQFLLDTGHDPDGAEREFRAAARRAEPGWAWALGRFLLDDARPDEAREYLQTAADAGDSEASALLADLDGEDLSDD